MNTHQIILKGVKEQLFFHDYLVLPNFGGFILKKSPAHFSPAGTLLCPPTKTVSFNSQLKQNDGIFVQWLQSELKCDHSTAVAHLNDFAEYCKSLLNNRGRLTIEGIGFFYLDFENNICFEPRQNNFLTNSFGLAPVSLKELEIEIPIKTETVFIDRQIPAEQVKGVPEIKRQRIYRRIAVAAVSGAVLFSALLIIVSSTKISGPLKSAVFGSQAVAVYSPVAYGELNLKDIKSDKKDYVADANGVASLELTPNKIIAVKAFEVEASTTGVETNARHNSPRSLKGNYEVVLGCFSILTNANKMVKKLSDQQIRAAVSGQNEKGLYVVSGGGFNTKEEALVQLAEIKSAYPNAWIKKAE
jgi:hypothetical protein